MSRCHDLLRGRPPKKKTYTLKSLLLGREDIWVPDSTRAYTVKLALHLIHPSGRKTLKVTNYYPQHILKQKTIRGYPAGVLSKKWIISPQKKVGYVFDVPENLVKLNQLTDYLGSQTQADTLVASLVPLLPGRAFTHILENSTKVNWSTNLNAKITHQPTNQPTFHNL